jgi:phosphoribosylglycinamide formyltransferase-1
VTRVVVLASGQGSTLQALLDAFPRDRGAVGPVVAAVICNTPGAGALDRGRRAGVPTVLVDHRGHSREAFEVHLCRAIDAHRPDLICLAGFLRILSPEVSARYAGRMLNTHPALLPAFGGRGMYGDRVHQAVLAAGAAISGCTIHLVDETPDGGPIVAQAAVPVLPDDTPERLAARVQAEERRLYPEVVRWFADGRLEVAGRRVAWRDGAGGP